MCVDQPRQKYALTLVETVVVVFIVAVLAVILVNRFGTSHCAPLSPRLICSVNLKSIGVSCMIYSNDNNSQWPTPAFDETNIGEIDYTVPVGGGYGSARSPSRQQSSVSGTGGTRQLSTTRAFWMLIRTGEVAPQSMICPASHDRVDENTLISPYYDFADARKVSYGFQVPFGPPATRANDKMDPRMVLAADRGPFKDQSISPPTNSVRPLILGSSEEPGAWRPFNSPNHGGDGQMVLFRDGHSSFFRIPTVGMNRDNIYTISKSSDDQSGVMFGESPWLQSAPPLQITTDAGEPGTNDSMIFP